MPTTDPPTAVHLKVKVPPGYVTTTATPNPVAGNNDQFDLGRLPVSTTIGVVRQHIQQTLPSNPPPERQRILYGGRALVDNEQTLADALNVKRDPEQTEYVVHLLVRTTDSAGVSRTPTPTTQRQQQHARGASTPAHVHSQPEQQSQQAQVPAQPEQLAQQHQALTRQLQMQQQIMFQHLTQRNPAQQLFPPRQDSQPNTAGAHGATQHATPTHTQGPPDAATQTQHQPPHHRHGQGFHIEGVGPDGQRFQFHQQTMHFPPIQVPGGMPNIPMMPGQQIPQPPAMNIPFPPSAWAATPGGMQPAPSLPPDVPPRGPSALDRARENISEMRRMLDEMANQNGATDDQRRQRIEDMQNRARSVNDYIDPLNLGPAIRNNATTNTSAAERNLPTSAQPQTLFPSRPPPPVTGLPPLPGVHPPLQRMPPPGHAQFQAPGMATPQEVRLPSNPNDVSVYLLSSPQGPQAILFSPQHGTHVTSQPSMMASNRGFQQHQIPNSGQRATAFHPTLPAATPAQQPQAQARPAAAAAPAPAPADPLAQAAQPNAADGQNAAAAQDALNLQPILNHFWMLFRILIFAYFLLGANLGWQKPVLLLAVGIAFWAFRMGVLGDGGPVRRWWNDVVGVPPRRQQAEEVQGQQPGGAAPAAGGRDGAAAVPAQVRPEEVGQEIRRPRVPVPTTPEQLAQHLLHEAEERSRQRRNWWREQFRPVERAIALFVASLWPGIGEAHVREQRRIQQEAEEEEAARRREADAQRLREEAKTDGGGGGGIVEGIDGSGVAGPEGANSSGNDAMAPAEGSGGVREREPRTADHGAE